MTLTEYNSFYNEIDSLISLGHLYDVIRRLKILCEKSQLADINEHISAVEKTYGYMLDFYVKGNEDPTRDKILDDIKIKLFEINSELYCRFVLKTQKPPLYDNFVNTGSDSLYSVCHELQTIMKSEGNSEMSINNYQADFERNTSELFRIVAYANSPLSNADMELLYSLINSDQSDNLVSGIAISAISISLFRNYSKWAYIGLINIYLNESVVKNKIRALVGLYFATYRFNNQISISAQERQSLNVLCDSENFKNDISQVVIQHMCCRNTDNLNKKVEKEILPEIMKFSSSFKNIPGGKNATTIDELIDANPEWEKAMENPELTSSLRDITEMQMDGADIFLNTFKHLSHHQFFSQIQNWFIDFSVNNTYIAKLSSQEIFRTFNSSYMISDTDKYAISLSMSGLNDSMKDMVARSFKEQSEALSVIGDDYKKDITTRKLFIRNVMQDLFRFFKFVGLGKAIDNPYSYRPVLKENLLILMSKNDINSAGVCTDYLMKYERFSDAIMYFNYLIEKGIASGSVYQKAGFCYQRINNHLQAVEMFKKAEIFSSANRDNDFEGTDLCWLLRHMAMSYKALGNLDIALKYYNELNMHQPDNLSVILNIGHTLLGLHRIDEALKFYYKADFISEGSPRTARPIAWCEFLKNNYDKSLRYYNSISMDNRTSDDWLNIGHLYFVQHDLENAMQAYRKSIDEILDNRKQFRDSFMNDADILLSHNLEMSDIELMIDKIYFDSDNAIKLSD